MFVYNCVIGTRQGDPISPNTFITYLERVMENIQDNGTGISVQGELINNLKFALTLTSWRIAVFNVLLK